MTLTLRTDRELIRANGRSNRYILARIEAPAAPPRAESERRRPVNVAFVIDRSGSMGGTKIQLARRAIVDAVGRLRPEDRFSIVAYDDQIEVVVESTPASKEARQGALARLASVDARGSTNLAEGWLRGCEQVAAHQTEGSLDRCLLLTDGLANVGITDPMELERHATALRERGIATTTFGVGADFDEVLLQTMASAGGGNFYYIETPQQIPDLVMSEIGEILDVVARDVVLAVTAPGAVVEPLGVQPVHQAGEATLVRLGELVSEQEIELVLKLTFPYGAVGAAQEAVLRLMDADGIVDAAPRALRWTYADTRSNDAQPRDRVVDLRVARVYAARARTEAAALNRSGRYDAARHVVAATAARIHQYAGDDPELLALAAELEQETEVVKLGMEEPMRKAYQASASYVMRCREPSGRAKRRGSELTR